MVFPFRYIAAYTNTKPREAQKGFEEFWGKDTISDRNDTELWQYYMEWIMFDFKLNGNSTFLVEYTLRNPDNLDKKLIDQFRQIAETQNYSEYEIQDVKRGDWIVLEDIFTGKTYKVYDKLGSGTIPSEGSMFARVARVDGRWYLVGANPATYPIIYTKRMKKMLQKNCEDNKKKLTPKDLCEMILTQRQNAQKPVKFLTKKELKNKRKKLEKDYIRWSLKYGATMNFTELVNKVYEENRVNVIDFWKKLAKEGLTEEFLMDKMQLFTDIWNNFPHKVLKGKAPVELYPD